MLSWAEMLQAEMGHPISEKSLTMLIYARQSTLNGSSVGHVSVSYSMFWPICFSIGHLQRSSSASSSKQHLQQQPVLQRARQHGQHERHLCRCCWRCTGNYCLLLRFKQSGVSLLPKAGTKSSIKRHRPWIADGNWHLRQQQQQQNNNNNNNNITTKIPASLHCSCCKAVL